MAKKNKAKDQTNLQEESVDMEIDLDENIIFFCYSGLESSINWFVAYELMKNKNSKLYEGSLFDWIAQNKLLYNKL